MLKALIMMCHGNIYVNIHDMKIVAGISVSVSLPFDGRSGLGF